MADQPPQQPQVKTIPITNFGGRLTRIINGEMNSGFAKFTTSWGYDPFTKPMNLTWLEQPTDITGPIANLPLTAKSTQNSGIANATVFLYDQGKKFYAIQPNSIANPNVDSVLAISSVAANLGSVLRPASMEFFGDTLQVYIGTEGGVNKVNFDGTADTFIGSSGFYTPNTYRPLKQFSGKLRFGNGATIGTIDSTGTVTSSVISVAGSNRYSELNPPLPPEAKVQDLDVSVDGNYLLMTGSNSTPDRVDGPALDFADSVTNDSAIYKWNGVDVAVTALTSLPSYSGTALQTYLGNNLFFANDAFGLALSDEEKKILMLPNNKSPLANATCTNGNFLTWICPETVGSTRYASLYYYGSTDEENQPGLYRVMRWATTQSSAQVYEATLNMLAGNSYATVSGTAAITNYSYGKHYLGIGSVNTSGAVKGFLLRFLVTPTGSGTSQLGVYETQTQLFSEKIAVKQVRVYTEPTVTGNGVQIDLIGSDGSVLNSNSLTYSYAAGTDITKLQGALQRINFNPTMDGSYAVGLRITNTGTTNMTIKKVEVDIKQSGK